MQCVVATDGLLRIDRVSAGVAVVIFSRTQKVAVGLHALRCNPPEGDEQSNVAYYVETAIPHALAQLEEAGISPPYSVAVAGGASMMGGSRHFDVGSRLVQAAKGCLAASGVQVKMEDTGGSRVRSVVLNIDSCKIKIS